MTSSSPAPRPRLLAPAWVFAILMASYAFFWQSRDWNSASRLMLTYALVDRGTIALNGLERQTEDKAFVRGRYFTDKLPGYSLLAVAPYVLAKAVLRLPDHPLGRPGFAYWPADYWATLGTSGLLTAATGALLALLAMDLGCGPRRAALVGLAYGLATPAYAYATLGYGHQASAFCLLAAFALLQRTGTPRSSLRAGIAGGLAAYAAVIELQVGPVSALLGLSLIALVALRKSPPSAIIAFGLGAAIPTLLLLGYNLLAFGSPWDMGYFHHATRRFADVHSARNPLGLIRPDWALVPKLLWERKRGLLFYAPIVALAPPGWVALAVRGRVLTCLVSFLAALIIFLVNLSYPEWTGGWSTGPRLLVPALPFLMIPVAGLLAIGGRATGLTALVLALAGGLLMLLFLGVGARIPETVADPLGEAVWPIWRGEALPGWATEGRFARNVVAWLLPGTLASLPEGWRWVQFLPLVAMQAIAIVTMARSLGPRRAR